MTDLIYDWNQQKQPALDWDQPQLVDRTLELLPKPLEERDRSRFLEGLTQLGVSLAVVDERDRYPETLTPQVVASRPDQVKPGVSALEIPDVGTLAPAILTELLEKAVTGGAVSIILWDREGTCSEYGVRNLLRFCREGLTLLGSNLSLEWRSGNQRGLAQPNGLVALLSGANRLHTSFFGLNGESATDLALVNLKLLGAWDPPLEGLRDFAEECSRLFDRPILPNYPVLGEDAFRTGTGVHAAAIIKADNKGDTALADAIYSGVPASWFGYRQQIEIGPMAGASNVIFWLEKNGYKAREDLVDELLMLAKSSQRVLTDDQILAVVTKV